jgi:hypothetical protein
MRNPVACVSCRTAKQRCLNNQDNQPCERCKSTGRAELCAYPPPGTSAMHRKPKRPRPSEDVPETTPDAAARAANSGSGAQQTLFRRHDAGVPSPTNAAPSPTASLSLLDGLDPFELLTDEVKNSYLRCSYKWSFHHTPTLLLRIRDRTLEPWMAWAMLALAIRYVVLQRYNGRGLIGTTSASSKSPRRRSARRLRPAMPTPHTPARSCSRTWRRRASVVCRRCSC